MRSSVSVYVDVDVSDVLDDLSDKDLLKIIEQRGLACKFLTHDDFIEAIQRVISATERRDIYEANRLANHLLECATGTTPDLSKEWDKIKAGTHPFLRIATA